MKLTDKITYTNECNLEMMARYEDNYFDLAIVDPPYRIGDINQSGSRNLHDKIEWNDEIPPDEYFEELLRVSKNQIVWGINYYADKIPSTGRIIHDKVANTGEQLKELSDADIASHSFGVNIKIFRYGWRGNVQGRTINWSNTGPNGRIHPTQKPIQLYEWILMKYAKKGHKILDTHGGSLSIAIACDKMGFELTACEKDPEHYARSIKRFKEITSQTYLFQQ